MAEGTVVATQRRGSRHYQKMSSMPWTAEEQRGRRPQSTRARKRSARKTLMKALLLPRLGRLLHLGTQSVETVPLQVWEHLARGIQKRHWGLPRRPGKRRGSERGECAPPSWVRPRLGRMRTAEAKPPLTRAKPGTQLRRAAKTRLQIGPRALTALRAKGASVHQGRLRHRSRHERVHAETTMRSRSRAPRRRLKVR